MKHASLFTGMGGFDLAAEWMGWENLFHCEWNPLLKKYLEKRYQTSKSYADIKKTDFTAWRGAVDVLSGGFPCQPYSLAGQRKGKEDERHLWPEMLRCIREVRPKWVVGENVLGIVNWNGGLVFDEVQADLDAEGYQVIPYVLPACAQDAPHRRDRVWFVAYAKSIDATGTGKCSDNQQQSNKAKIRKGFWDKSQCDGTIQPTSDTASDRRHGERTGFEAKEGQQPGPGSTGIMEGGFEGLCESGATSDTNSQRPKKRMQASARRQDRQENQPRVDNRIERLGGKWDASDTCSTKLQGSKLNGGTRSKGQIETESGRFSESIRATWDQFPTQSPVRIGDDGFPDGLFGSFVRDYFGGNLREEEIQQILQTARSRFAKAAIMACGNAVVPQVVFQILKAIDTYENGKIQTSTL